jgi:AraC-like DNA-binding protein
MAPSGPLEETRPSGNGRARGLVSNRTSGRRIHAATFQPPADLADVVDCFWVGRWDLREQEPHVTELIGDPVVNLVFERGDCRVVGVWTKLWRRELSGQGEVRAAKLRCGSASAFFDDVSALSNRMSPLPPDLLPHVDAVLDPPEQQGLAALADALRARRRPVDQLPLAAALAEAIRSPSVTRVDQLAEDFGLTVRAVQRLFRTHVGAPPKWVIRWRRLQEVAVAVEAGNAPDLAALSYQLGYADQAHLARDFRSATGRTLRGFQADVHR